MRVNAKEKKIKRKENYRKIAIKRNSIYTKDSWEDKHKSREREIRKLHCTSLKVDAVRV